ncbi:MAG: hypothetical protein JJ863_22500 [Deltaproteobacteria bacterium]|nr:hypothetical protein [Deltaproteobacteria bacterium]
MTEPALSSPTPPEPAEGMPEIAYEVVDGSLDVRVGEGSVPREAVFDAALELVDRCYVYFRREADDVLAVRFVPRAPVADEQVEALVHGFAERLAHAITSTRVALAAGQLRDYYTARALFSSGSVVTVDDLLAELDDEELDDDPLEVDVPWAPKAADD